MMKITTLATLKKLFPALVIAGLLLMSCGGDSATENDTAGDLTAGTSETGNDTEASNGNSGDNPYTGNRPAYVPPKATQAPLTLGLSSLRVKSGSPACLDVQVADFTQLLSMQYSVKWDPTLLQYESIQNFQLGGLGPEDFGAHRAAEGILTSVWIDENLQGVTLPDGATVYQLCFQVTGAAGQSAEVQLSDGPTPFEAVNLKEEVVDIKGVAGRITIQ